ncbi:MAG: hypothetical protein GWN73_22225, partial [Actinobacteria bacterium]|nr:hypothetical protein [Actinomycetota bacterium]NIU67982.1 hypothetical protein [Actinomycetota bacterium]
MVLAVGGVIALGIFAQFAESVGEGPTEATVSLDSLSDGTCFEDPGTAPFSSVAPIDCANWHEYELIGRVTLPDGASPVDQTLDEA